ncbi:hypothetical protein ACQ4PT_013578 [Festuca glaucescens]
MATEAMIRSQENSTPHPVSSPSRPKWRDWSNLGEGPAGLIADRQLANDVADYIRLRAVCCPWRRCSTDPRDHDILDPRFHPRNWIMLRETVAAFDYRRHFLNVSIGQCIRVTLPELSGPHVFGPTTEGLLVLLNRTSYAVRLLNPLTGQVTDLPPATTLLRLHRYRLWSGDDLDLTNKNDLTEEFKVLAAGLADDCTFAVYFNGIRMLALAKIGDECWTLVDDTRSLEYFLAISFKGRFYCPTDRGLMVVDTSANQPPRLVLAAELTKVFPRTTSTIHLVDNDGELILVYRNIRRRRFNKRRGKLITTKITESLECKAYR